MHYGSRSFGYYVDTDSNGKLSKRKKAALCEYAMDRDIFFDNSTDHERPKLKNLFELLQTGDTVYFYSLDNILKNNQQIKEMLTLLKNNQIYFRVIDLPTTLIDVTDLYEQEKSLSDIAMDFIFDVINKEADKEIKAKQHRQALGFTEAKSNGVKLGRKSKPYPETFEDDYRRWKAGEITAASIYSKYGWSNPTFYRHVKQYEMSMVV